MNALFKRLNLIPSTLVSARDLVKRANPSRFVSKGLLFFLFVFFPISLAAVLSASQHVNATEAIIGLSHAGDPAEIKPLIVGRALALEPGDKLTFYDAPAAKELTSITIPNDPTKAHRPERLVEFIAPAMAVLNRYFATPAAAGANNLNASPFFDAIGPKVTEHGPGERILLIGNPWFTAPGAFQKPEFIGGFPSDGLILSDHLHSPFGTSGEHDLEGATVDYCYITDASNGFLSVDHKDRLHRAWSLLIQQRGGQLTSFMGDDLKSCFDRFSEPKPPEGRQFAIDPKNANMLYFYRAKDVVPRVIDAPPVIAGPPGVVPSASDIRAEAARFDKPAKTTPPSTRTGTAWFGIQWQEPIDLDLYVRCETSSAFLFFGNLRSNEGHHNGDHRVGTGKEFESVNLTTPCQDISKAQVFVNFYSGSVPTSPKGVFAIEFDGGLYKADFEIPAHSGNGGAGGNEAGAMGSPYWVKIDLASVLKLNASTAAHSRPRATR